MTHEVAHVVGAEVLLAIEAIARKHTLFPEEMTEIMMSVTESMMEVLENRKALEMENKKS